MSDEFFFERSGPDNNIKRTRAKTVAVSSMHCSTNWLEDKSNIHHFVPEIGFTAEHFSVHFLSRWKNAFPPLTPRSKWCTVNQNKHPTKSLGNWICIALGSINHVEPMWRIKCRLFTKTYFFFLSYCCWRNSASRAGGSLRAAEHWCTSKWSINHSSSRAIKQA